MNNMFAVVIPQEDLDKFVSLKKYIDRFKESESFDDISSDFFEKAFEYACQRSSIGMKCMSQIQEQLKNGNMFDNC